MIDLDGTSLSIESVVKVARDGERVRLSDIGKKQIQRSRKNLESFLATGKTYYGINTGFGSLMDVRIQDSDMLRLQENLIRSHSAGVGDPLDPASVRAMMLIRANSLTKGYSGVTIDLIETLVAFLNNDIVPYVPRYGSVGASGDLAPLAHIALCLMGESKVFYNGEEMPTEQALSICKLDPHRFREKEGVAFTNGTSSISGLLALSVHEAIFLTKAATAASSLSLQALSGTPKPFTKWVVETRKHSGQSEIAKNMRTLLEGYIPRKERVQDAYSLRCIPQVHGSVLDTAIYVQKVLTDEINSVTDNPILNEEDVISAGNFHGEPVALVCDFLAIALTDLGNMCERRIFRLTDRDLSGLPPFLTENSGLNSGFMIPQYTAAALCNMNKVLSHPASADTIPTSADQEDHVSMGMNAAIKLLDIVNNLRNIVAIEFLVACQGVDLSGAKLSDPGKDMHALVRSRVNKVDEDRYLSPDIEAISTMLLSGEFRKELEGLTG